MEIVCKDCKQPFEFTEGEEEFLRKQFPADYKAPVRCKPCREKNKARKSKDRK